MCDIFRFLNVPLITKIEKKNGSRVKKSYFGYIPRSILQMSINAVDKLHSRTDVKILWNKAFKAENMYWKHSNNASRLGVMESKNLDFDVIHPLFVSFCNEEDEKNDIIKNIKRYKPNNTIINHIDKKPIVYKFKVVNDCKNLFEDDQKTGVANNKKELVFKKKYKRYFRDDKYFIFCKNDIVPKEEKISAPRNYSSSSQKTKFKRNLKWDGKKKNIIYKTT